MCQTSACSTPGSHSCAEQPTYSRGPSGACRWVQNHMGWSVSLYGVWTSRALQLECPGCGPNARSLHKRSGHRWPASARRLRPAAGRTTPTRTWRSRSHRVTASAACRSVPWPTTWWRRRGTAKCAAGRYRPAARPWPRPQLRTSSLCSARHGAQMAPQCSQVHPPRRTTPMCTRAQPASCASLDPGLAWNSR